MPYLFYNKSLIFQFLHFKLGVLQVDALQVDNKDAFAQEIINNPKLFLIGRSLEKIPTHQDTIRRLLTAAQRNTTDSKVTVATAENRFDAAYKAIMQIANATLHANGYRALTSKPGHHQTMLQLLPQTNCTRKKFCIIQNIF